MKNPIKDCNCHACRTVQKRTARRDAEMKRAKRRIRRSGKKGLPVPLQSLTYRF